MLDGRDSYLEAAHELWGTLIKRSGLIMKRRHGGLAMSTS